jgi:hypothetical protein
MWLWGHHTFRKPNKESFCACSLSERGLGVMCPAYHWVIVALSRGAKPSFQVTMRHVCTPMMHYWHDAKLDTFTNLHSVQLPGFEKSLALFCCKHPTPNMKHLSFTHHLWLLASVFELGIKKCPKLASCQKTCDVLLGLRMWYRTDPPSHKH